MFKDAKTLYAFESPGKSELESLKKRTGQKSLGRAMRASGLRPNFPVVLVPGLASSALEVWDSEEAPEWIGGMLTSPGFSMSTNTLQSACGSILTKSEALRSCRRSRTCSAASRTKGERYVLLSV